MKNLDIIIPVRNEEGNIVPLIQRIDSAMKKAEIKYNLIFIDDRSTDKTVKNLKALQVLYPIEVYTKQGKPGKAYSILEGSKYSKSENLAMIDADLQYPPEALPQMFEQLSDSGVVIAKRTVAHGSKIRRFISKTFSTVFGGLLHNLNVDVQSGMKVFKREVIEKVDANKVTPWTLDLSLVLIARDLGLGISEVDIEFDKRINGASKVSVVRTSIEIGKNALKLKFFRKKQFKIKPIDENSMVGAGTAVSGKRFITHTTLDEKHLALKTFTTIQKFIIGILIAAAITGLVLNPLTSLLVIVGVLSAIYFIDVIFNIGVVLKSLHFPPEIQIAETDISKLNDKDLPVYTILCPLYREANVLPLFLESIEKLNWPKDKLDVILLLEEDDKETIREVSKLNLPPYVRSLVTPDSQPKTKPKACNYGLAHAKGEYLVIYDAEDRPDPDQLKKAYLGFKTSGEKIVCLQAKLNYFNPHQNLLTRFFTAEYSLWFDVMLPGLQSINTVIPLGGTSNHFKTKTLKELKGWDPFNVTEDCDLGVRIFKKGWSTAIIDSVTLEEANSNWGNWVRQRSRWLKGYMQTYLVHMRNPFEFIRQNGWHAFVFQLIIGARISFMLINPILWLTTISYFALYAYVGPAIEEVFPSVIFYMAVFSLLVGNFSYIYNYMIGALRRDHYSLVKYVYLVPFYWLVASYAAAVAAYQLVVKPHYWEKTLHGLHLSKVKVQKATQEIVEDVKDEINHEIIPNATKELTGLPWYKRFAKILSTPKAITASVIFLSLNFIAGITNLGFNIYLGRVINFENLALVSLVGSFWYFSSVPQIALSNTITNKVGFLDGKGKSKEALIFLGGITKKFLLISFILTAGWFFLTPWMSDYFRLKTVLPFLLFAPVWTLGIAGSLIKGFLSGKLALVRVGLILAFEALAKFALATFLITMHLDEYVYASIPLSVFAGLIFAVIVTNGKLNVPTNVPMVKKDTTFPIGFFLASVLTIIAPMAFLSLDVVLAKHYLSAEDAGRYALVSIVGKIIFFLGALISQLIMPLVSRNEGAGKSSDNILLGIFVSTSFVTGVGFVIWGLLGQYTVPLVFGQKALDIIPLLEPFLFAMMCFTLSQIFVAYYLAKKVYTFPIVSLLLTSLQFALISVSHSTVEAIVWDMFIVALANLLIMVGLHFGASYIKIFESNLADFFGLLSSSKALSPDNKKKINVLILNWRDTRHIWAGGAEAYIHELAKIWVSQGIRVTVFCGNDSKNDRNEVIDGVQIVRRGGFYTVYIWAFLYYILKFRGKFDVIIDSANGIPFFTPLYVGKPKLLLIHHVHQEVFRNHLPYPLAVLASFMEAKLMPLFYKKQKVVTVSNSSKDEIIKLTKGLFDSVEIVNPGIHINNFLSLTKTDHPSLIYLGRLQPYKNIDVVLRAFGDVLEKFPKAILTIAGFGESLHSLKKLADNLKIENSVIFTGKVSDEEKYKLLSESWIMLQPSMVEGWGITVIEANASRTPVIASNVNGLKDSVVDGATGFLVKPKDVKMFSKVMIDLIENEEFRNYLSNQSHKWAQNFSWINSANKFLTIIQEEVEKSQRVKIITRGILAKE